MPGILSSLVTIWLLADGQGTVRGILGVVLGVGALIFFHELGHFLAAKWAGVRVEVFSLGFGTRLIGFRRGDTDYRLSLLPLGGYVKMLGQADDDPGQAPTDRADDFRNKSVGRRFVILVAGVVMNVILAAVGFVLAFGLGLSFNAPEVGTIAAGSAASRADLRPGDIILRIDGHEVIGWQDVSALVALSAGEIQLEVLRDGAIHRTVALPARGPEDTYARLGISPEAIVGELEEGSPLALAGVRAASPTSCDRILNISPVDSRCDPALRMPAEVWARLVDETPGPLAVTVERTSYDPSDFRPVASERFQADVTFARRPVYTIGVDVPDHAWVRGIREDSAAARAGVQEGDRIVSLDGSPVTHSNLRDVVREVGARSGERPVLLVVERGAPPGAPQRLELSVTLELQNEDVLRQALEGVTEPAQQLALRLSVGNWLLGIEYRADVIASPSALPLADPDAEPVVLQPGDRLVELWRSGGLWWNKQQPWLSPDAVTAELNQRKDEPFKLVWLPRGSQEQRSAVVKASPHSTRTYADLQASMAYRQVVIERGPLGAWTLGMEQTWIQTRRILLTLRSFFTGMVSPRELGGPIQIVNVAYGVAREDSLSRLLHLLAILSVNLAVINILPIPVLDGGHIFFLFVEKLKGRPVSGEVLIWAQWIGLGCILALMALVFFNDIARLGQ